MSRCAIPAPVTPQVERVGPDWLIWCDERWRPRPEWFDATWHEAAGLADGEATGRGATLYTRLEGIPVVLRHYRRGGAARHLMADRYGWRGLRATRAWREIVLLARLERAGLPVPCPVAARIRRTGARAPLYRADLLSERLPGTRTLAQSLATAALPESAWRELGATLARFHAAGVDHADLNAHNILLDAAGAVYLIDFDRGRLRRRGGRWRERNLSRLRRSLDKLAAEDRAFQFTDAGWSALHDAWRDRLSATTDAGRADQTSVDWGAQGQR